MLKLIKIDYFYVFNHIKVMILLFKWLYLLINYYVINTSES